MSGLVRIAAGSLCAVAVAIGVSPERAPLVAAPSIDDPLLEALSGIDFIPDRPHLDSLLGAAAAEELIAISRDATRQLPTGVRIRAYRALALYPAETVGALIEAVERHVSEFVDSGPEIPFAKAAVSALATTAHFAGAGDKALALGQLGNALQHRVADLRAAAARALGESGLAGASALIRDRLEVESSLLVRASLDRALAKLEDN